MSNAHSSDGGASRSPRRTLIAGCLLAALSAAVHARAETVAALGGRTVPAPTDDTRADDTRADDTRADETPADSGRSVELGPVRLALPDLGGFRELPGLSDQLKGHWAGTLGAAAVRIAYRVYPLDRFPFSDPGDVTDLLEENFARRDPDFALSSSRYVEGRFGYAPYASLATAPLPDGDSTGELLLLGGLLPEVAYSIEVYVAGPLTDEERAMLLGFLEQGVTSEVESWNPDWTLDEIRARWQRDVPFDRDGLEKPIRTAHYIVLTNSSAGRKFAQEMERAYKTVQKMFPFEEVEGRRLMPVLLFRTRDQYLDFYVHVAGIGREAAARSKGHAWRDYYATYYEAPNDPVHIHEATHQIFMNRLRLRGGGSWFQEGVAEYCSTRENERKAFARRYAKDRKHVPFREFMRMSALIQGDAQNTYLQAASITEFLCERWQKEKFPEFVRRVGKLPRGSVDRIDETLRDLYGVGIEELEEAWVRYWSRR